MRDFITTLTVRYPPGRMMTKRLYRATNGAIGKSGYDRAYTFDVKKDPIDCLADLAEVLLALNAKPNKVVIRGNPVGGMWDVRRTLTMFAPDQHHWFMCDFDDVPLPLCVHPDDAEIALGYLVRLLPAPFHDASYYWQWSCGHGINRQSLRAHLFFWSSTAHTDKEFEEWAKTINGDANEKLLDPSVYRTVQPNYVAAPILADDVIDPVSGERCGIHMGEIDEVSITIPSIKWEDHVRQQEREEYAELVEYDLRKPYEGSQAALSVKGTERYLDCMNRIGDDLDGFHDPMRTAIMYWALDGDPAHDAEFKDALRIVVLEAVCTKQRDLDHYMSDYYLDSSLRGAREKIGSRSPVDVIKSRAHWNQQRNQSPVSAEHYQNAIDMIKELSSK